MLFTAFFLLVEVTIRSKIRFQKPKITISLKSTFPLEGKKLTGDSVKWREKIVCTSWKISFPLARMSFFSQNCFFLIPVMVSTSSKIALTKKYCFH